MKLFVFKSPMLAKITAAPAVTSEGRNIDFCGACGSGSKGFTLIEVLTVVILIGILSALAYAGLMDLILSNRAKESAQTMRTTVERALAEGKRQNKSIIINLNNNSIFAIDSVTNDTIVKRELLSGGFTYPTTLPNPNPNEGKDGGVNFVIAGGAKAGMRVGLSGIGSSGYFVACGAKGYCGAAVKFDTLNYFAARIKKGTNADWEDL